MEPEPSLTGLPTVRGWEVVRDGLFCRKTPALTMRLSYQGGSLSKGDISSYLACVSLARIKRAAVSHLADNRCWGRSPRRDAEWLALLTPGTPVRERERMAGGRQPERRGGIDLCPEIYRRAKTA